MDNAVLTSACWFGRKPFYLLPFGHLLCRIPRLPVQLEALNKKKEDRAFN